MKTGIKIFKKYKEIIIIFIFTMIIFLPYCTTHFTTDTYRIIEKGYLQYGLEQSFLDGRLFTFIMLAISEYLNISIKILIPISTTLSIIILTYAVKKISDIILSYKKTDNKITKLMVILISYYTIFNFSIIENLEYIENVIMSLSIMFYLLSAHELVNKERKFCSLIYTILGIISYQGTISALLIFFTLFSIIKYKKINMKKLIELSIYIIIGIIVDYGIMKIAENYLTLEQTRGLSNIKQLISNIYITAIYTPYTIIMTGETFPSYLFIIFTTIILTVSLTKVNKNNGTKMFYYPMIIILLGIGFSMMISILNTTSFFTARIRFALGAVIGILYLYLYVETDILEVKNIKNKILILTFITYAIVTTISYYVIINSNIQINKYDKELAREIIEYIEKYEQENNIKIEKVRCNIIRNSVENAKYEDVIYKGSVSAIKTEWSAVESLSYFSGRKFKKEKTTEEKIQKEYFCQDNILSINVYMY